VTHLAALAVILLALMPVVGLGASFSGDEGAAIVQARSLARGQGWVVEHPVPEADPTGAAYPLELSERGPKGVAPYAKHPLYALLLAGADRVAGVAGMVLLSVSGTVAAAGLAGVLAGRLDRSLARPAVWVVGLASPLLFDSYLVVAHTLGAACAVAALVAAARAMERRSGIAALAVMPCVAAAVLFRTEAVFFALGLAFAAVAVGLAGGRRAWRPAVLVAAGSAVAMVGARLGEGVWIGHILGGAGRGTGTTHPPPTSGLVADRWQAFLVTWLRPSDVGPRLPDLLLAVMLGALILGAFAVRRGRPGATAMAAVAGTSAMAALVVAPANVVPGLLVACPVVVAGLLLTGRRAIVGPTALLATLTSVAFAVCVLATQYSTGGSGEWGGRYFALALPVALPVLLLGIRSRGSRPFVVGLVVCSLALGVMAVGGLRSTHRFGTGLIAAMDRAAGPDHPVVVTTSPLLPRLAWPTFGRQRWLLATPSDLGALVGRLGPAGIGRFTFVTPDQSDVSRLPPDVVQEASTTYQGWRIFVLRSG
jgi:hypothetical protein